MRRPLSYIKTPAGCTSFVRQTAFEAPVNGPGSMSGVVTDIDLDIVGIPLLVGSV